MRELPQDGLWRGDGGETGEGKQMRVYADIEYAKSARYLAELGEIIGPVCSTVHNGGGLLERRTWHGTVLISLAATTQRGAIDELYALVGEADVVEFAFAGEVSP
jgi:hypothetical protein